MDVWQVAWTFGKLCGCLASHMDIWQVAWTFGNQVNKKLESVRDVRKASVGEGREILPGHVS